MNRELKSKIILEFGTQEDFAVAVNERPVINDNYYSPSTTIKIPVSFPS